jgi:hypothetical protein
MSMTMNFKQRLAPLLRSVAGIAAGVSACATDDGKGDIYSGTGGDGDGDGDGTGDGDGDGDGDGTGDGDGDGDGDGEPIFDVGSDQTDLGSEDGPCDKVDVLYVIDNSPSMYDEQQNLISNFPTFVSEMQTALAEVDSYHIGVVTTDDFGNSGLFDDGANTVNQSYPECQKLGGLVVEAQAGSCLPFAGDGNFITEQDDLATKFNCVANVGEDGDSDEKVGDSLISLLNSQFGGNDVSECNDGFLRNDALLVIVILTDENDSSDTDPEDWYAAVVAAKGIPENAVVLSLTWNANEQNCQENLSESTGYTIVEFVEMFPNHATGNICDASYAGFFSSTVPVIDSACDDFEPAG